MQPLRIEPIGTQLAIQWEDRTESFIGLEKLRRACPCAGCKGETDVMGQLHRGPEQPLNASSTVLVRILPVGNYAVQPVWGDGHSTGIFTFDHLHRLAEPE